MKQNSWVRLLTCITGLVNQEQLLQNEYLAPKKSHPAGAVASAFASFRSGENHAR
jgi:hypothetical protein